MTETFALFLLKCFYLMLPAYFANMAPVMVKRINLFVFPVDFNKKIGSNPILGRNKTFRGLIFGIIFAVIVAYLQYLLYDFEAFRNISFLSYKR